jgi:hypothetical protein
MVKRNWWGEEGGRELTLEIQIWICVITWSSALIPVAPKLIQQQTAE